MTIEEKSAIENAIAKLTNHYQKVGMFILNIMIF